MLNDTLYMTQSTKLDFFYFADKGNNNKKNLNPSIIIYLQNKPNKIFGSYRLIKTLKC